MLVPLAPTNVTVLVVSAFSLSVSWNPPLIPNGYLTHYNVYCQESQLVMGSGSGMFVLPTSPYHTVFTSTVRGDYRNATVTGFTPFTSYGCYVSANTSVGEGSVSVTVFQTTDEYSKFRQQLIFICVSPSSFPNLFPSALVPISFPNFIVQSYEFF